MNLSTKDILLNTSPTDQEKSSSVFYLGTKVQKKKLRSEPAPYPAKQRADLGMQKVLLMLNRSTFCYIILLFRFLRITKFMSIFSFFHKTSNFDGHLICIAGSFAFLCLGSFCMTELNFRFITYLGLRCVRGLFRASSERLVKALT